MSAKPHLEKHFSAPDSVRDVVIGMADGLTVPFALAAGLSGAISTNDVIIIACLAEIAAGAIAMGLGGYLAAKTDQQHYKTEKARETYEVDQLPQREREEIAKIFENYGLKGEQLEAVVNAIASDKERWVAFMMRHELGLEEPEAKRAPISAATIGGAYILGGLIPLAAYFFKETPQEALVYSSAMTALALLIFGAIKAFFTGTPIIKGSFQTFLIGGLAATAAYSIARLLG